MEWAREEELLFDFLIGLSVPFRGQDIVRDAESAG